MKRLTILTNNADDMLKVVDLVRDKIGEEIKFIEITEQDLEDKE